MEMEDNNNNTVITSESIDEFKLKDVGLLDIDINENLEPPSECCIYKVPKDLRKLNEEAYTPQLISIGPFHYGEEKLRGMEKQKIRYQREFISNRINKEIWQTFVSYIQNNEKFIHNCYAEMPKFSKLQFLTIILYDAVFIIEFLLRLFEYRRDFLIDSPTFLFTLTNDLILLENQLPYFVLEELYRLAYPNLPNLPNLPDQIRLRYPSLFSLCSLFYWNVGDVDIPTDEMEIKHFTDLVRHKTTWAYRNQLERRSVTDLPCSVKLQKSGVKFRGTRRCLTDIRFEKKKLRIPWFQVKELQIPRIKIDDQTEIVFRNIMALEQCHYPRETLFCNYIDLMDNLITTEKDVNLLVDSEIIINRAGDTKKIADMFNKLSQNIILNESCYWKLKKDLNLHYDRSWNHKKETFERIYFSEYWRAAGVLLLLTLIQTICSIKQVV